MRRYIVQRLLSALMVLVGVSILVFLVLHLTPGDPVQIMLGPTAKPGDIDRLRAEFGLDDPLPVQYLRWVSRALQGDLGRSIQLNRPVLPELLGRFQATLILATAAAVISFSLGLVLGVVSAVNHNRLIDRLVAGFAMLAVSMPAFWIGMIGIVLFAVNLRWLPASGMYPPQGEPSWGKLFIHLLMPATTLALVPMAVIARFTRSQMLEVLGQEFVLTARAKGVPRARVIFDHAFGNTLVALITLLGLEAGILLAGAVYVETVFAWPGIGSLMVEAILKRDFPIVQGGVLVIATSYVLINLVTDLIHAAADPRIRVA
jgi:peptide/nickel transport system permease protein